MVEMVNRSHRSFNFVGVRRREGQGSRKPLKLPFPGVRYSGITHHGQGYKGQDR